MEYAKHSQKLHKIGHTACQCCKNWTAMQNDAKMIRMLYSRTRDMSHSNPANRQSTKKQHTYQLYIHSMPSDDGLQICPKHVEVD
jgi:hypothetical protein